MYKEDLVLNNLQWLIRRKTSSTNQPTNHLNFRYTHILSPPKKEFPTLNFKWKSDEKLISVKEKKIMRIKLAL